ncbi:hypothetical protein Esti_003873 [Eimeria stiedai]
MRHCKQSSCARAAGPVAIAGGVGRKEKQRPSKERCTDAGSTGASSDRKATQGEASLKIPLSFSRTWHQAQHALHAHAEEQQQQQQQQLLLLLLLSVQHKLETGPCRYLLSSSLLFMGEAEQTRSSRLCAFLLNSSSCCCCSSGASGSSSSRRRTWECATALRREASYNKETGEPGLRLLGCNWRDAAVTATAAAAPTNTIAGAAATRTAAAAAARQQQQAQQQNGQSRSGARSLAASSAAAYNGTHSSSSSSNSSCCSSSNSSRSSSNCTMDARRRRPDSLCCALVPTQQDP